MSSFSTFVMDVRRTLFPSVVMMLALTVFGILPTLVSATCPSTQSPFAPGWDTLLSTIVREMAGTLLTTSRSICTECCIFQFGLGSCGASTLWDGIVRDPGCNGIWPREQALGFPGIQGVDHVWISECTGAFTSCNLYSSPDCTGNQVMKIDNSANVCHSPGWYIFSFDCQID
ncbi:hypothetical protein PV05_02556 [Exophiala xenobiotica]|uniref:Uncharacterized protein n=1 Tax=Exophiala xenobiotica TaxID=348802 RepID=A0A0D2FD99_9EURO|nr:uncharacterized protein PV05_02556 [Exophiala xenobiotica]KIW58004.1 hypothetical protein PV05_02556 [Exophiala xenobiotica]